MAVASRAVGWLRRRGYLREAGYGGDDECGNPSGESKSPWVRCLQGSLGVEELMQWLCCDPAGRSPAMLCPRAL